MSLPLRAILLLGAAAIAMPTAADAMPPRPATAHSAVLAAAYNSTVYQIQAALNAHGFDAGPADGLMGSRTRIAIEAYQRKNGLLTTGQPSDNLLQHMQATTTRPTPQAAQRPPAIAERNVERLQRALGRLGYEVAVNGRADAQTKAAVRAYQRDERLLVTGEIDEALLAHVRGNLREARHDRRGGEDAADTEMVTQIQAGLRARGYAVDNVDGKLDRSTEEAIRGYQRDRGDAQTGKPGAELVAQLSEGRDAPVNTRENIRLVQQELNRRGYTAGPADGVMGPSTRDAIRNYRLRSNLPASALVNAELLASLGISTDVSTDATVNTPAPTTGAWKTVLYDSFEDNDYAVNPHWQVLAQTFTINDGTLQSTVVEPQLDDKEQSRQVVSNILGKVLGVAAQRQSSSAAIAQAASFGEEFKLQVRVREIGGAADAQMHFGVYRGHNAVDGYRVTYDGSARQPLALLSVDSRGATVLASTDKPSHMTDRNWHTIDFSRAADGQIILTVDGVTMLVAFHGGAADGGFNGFSFMNAAGTWGMDDIRIEARP